MKRIGTASHFLDVPSFLVPYRHRPSKTTEVHGVQIPPTQVCVPEHAGLQVVGIFILNVAVTDGTEPGTGTAITVHGSAVQAPDQRIKLEKVFPDAVSEAEVSPLEKGIEQFPEQKLSSPDGSPLNFTVPVPDPANISSTAIVPVGLGIQQ